MMQRLFGPDRLLFVAGPCVVEDEETVFTIAGRLREICATRPVQLVFKASFDKANRTSVNSFRGPGMERSLEILAAVRERFGLPIDTDVHESAQVPRVAEVADVLQIPAFLCRQTDLLLAAAASKKPILVKKGQFCAPEDMRYAVEKIRSTNPGAEIGLVERGTTFGYHNLVVDFRSLPKMREFAPVVFDGTHSVQRPSGAGGASGGEAAMIPTLVRAAAAAGIDGLFLETHVDPARALSDGPNMIALDDLPGLLDAVEAIRATGIEKGRPRA